MKNLREEIITLIKNYAGEGNDKFVDKLVALFKQQMKEIMPKKKTVYTYTGAAEINADFSNVGGKKIKVGDKTEFTTTLTDEELAFNEAIDQLLKNIEGL